MTQNFAPLATEKTDRMLLVERQFEIELDAYLREQYHEKGLRLRDIAAALGQDTGTISRWMASRGIPRRVRTKVAAS